MCSVERKPSKENCKTDIREREYSSGISRASSSFNYSISSNSNWCDCGRKDYKEQEPEEEEKEETKGIVGEEDDLLPSNYLNQKIFGLLIPALGETLIEASKWKALRVQKCRFNGLDYIAQILWNRNPRRSKTFSSPLDVFEIPPFKEYLRLHPRPYYPKSWLWSDDEAALHIQRYVRGWLVRKCADVQEMRQFWRHIAASSFSGKKESCIVQPHRVLGKAQDDTEYDVTDEDLLRCKKYRAMIYNVKI